MMPTMGRKGSSSQRGRKCGGLCPGMRRSRRPGRVFETGLRPLGIDSSNWGDAVHTDGVDDVGGGQGACGFRIEPACRSGDWRVP